MSWRKPVSITGHILVAISFLFMIQSSLTSSGLSYQFAIVFIIGLALMVVSRQKKG
ncbi:MAG: hypothetical protein ACWA44_12620 [Thiotrichales bacterium]